jgi:KDO2-lipid IV(A) lauroyltransferase
MIIVNYFIIAFIWLITLLPLKLLHLISDLLYFVVYYIAGYRKKVVFENLHNSFPEKSHNELKVIAKKFYRNYTALFIECMKSAHCNSEKIASDFKLINSEIVESHIKNNKNVCLVFGHCSNWEWMVGVLGYKNVFNVCAIYKAMDNKYFDKYFSFLRTKLCHGRITLVPHVKATRIMLKNKNIASTYVFAADQSPAIDEIFYWTSFLNQETPVFLGVEKTSKMLDAAVVFVDIKIVGRGKFVLTFTEITSDPKNTAEFEITEKHVRMLEKGIREQPHNWLWTHKRWKHKREVVEKLYPKSKKNTD